MIVGLMTGMMIKNISIVTAKVRPLLILGKYGISKCELIFDMNKIEKVTLDVQC